VRSERGMPAKKRVEIATYRSRREAVSSSHGLERLRATADGPVSEFVRVKRPVDFAEPNESRDSSRDEQRGRRDDESGTR